MCYRTNIALGECKNQNGAKIKRMRWSSFLWQGLPRVPKPLPKRPSNTRVYVLMGTLVAALPFSVGLLKGFEKRTMWKPAPAIIEEVTPTYVVYRYVAFGKTFRHKQEQQVGRNPRFTVGDRVFVNVNTRNEALSVLEPPLITPVWRFGFNVDRYKGVLVR